MFTFICLFLAFTALMLLAFEFLMFAITIGICLCLIGMAYMLISFWFKFFMFLTWPYGFLILIGVVLLIWLIGKLRK